MAVGFVVRRAHYEPIGLGGLGWGARGGLVQLVEGLGLPRRSGRWTAALGVNPRLPVGARSSASASKPSPGWDLATRWAAGYAILPVRHTTIAEKGSLGGIVAGEAQGFDTPAQFLLQLSDAPLQRLRPLPLLHGSRATPQQEQPLLGLLVGVVAGLAMFGNMILSGVIEAGVPLVLRRLGQDPAVSSAVDVTTATDVMGFLLFLGFAMLVIERLA